MVLSRRALLIGAGSVAVLGAGGALGLDLADHSLVERGLHHFGLSSSPDFQVPDAGAPQRRGTLVSRYMKTSLGWTVSVPPKGQAPVGIIYCLHGKGGTNRMAFDDVHVPDVAAYVGLPVAVAAVDGGSDSYWHRRADGTDAMAMLMEEFVPLVTSMVGDHPQALMGWSMGGYGALLAAERYRPAFVAVAPASPAIWLTPGATAPGAFDSPADFYANNVLTDLDPLRGMAVAVACGTGDPFYDSTRHLVSLMDFPHRAFYGPGFHDPAYWRSVAPAQLRAVRGAFG